MNQRTQVPARTERLRTVSVPKAVAAFLVAGLFVLTAVGIVLALALRQTATAEAIRVARLVTSLRRPASLARSSSTKPSCRGRPMTSWTRSFAST